MKVYIGPYKDFIGPYQVIRYLIYIGFTVDFCDFISDKCPKWMFSLSNKIYSWREDRKVKVKIHRYDTWNMDSTLAYIILPMLKKIKDSKDGSPFVDDEDVPDNLKSTETKDTHHEKWTYVLGEIIFAFECKNTDWESQYWTGKTTGIESTPTGDKIFNPLTGKEEDTFTINFLGDRKCDREGLKKQQERISNGFKLFGKYYECLWD